MNMLIKNLCDATFEADVLQSDGFILVDFWAEWCGPCKAMAPLLEDIAETYAGRVVVAKLDVDANNELPVRFGIRGLPTLILFKGGQVVAQKVGALSRTQLIRFLDANL